MCIYIYLQSVNFVLSDEMRERVRQIQEPGMVSMEEVRTSPNKKRVSLAATLVQVCCFDVFEECKFVIVC